MLWSSVRRNTQSPWARQQVRRLRSLASASATKPRARAMHPRRPPSSPRLAVRCRARSSTASAAGEAPAMLGSMGRSTPSTDGWVGVPVAGASRCSRIRSLDDAASAFGDRGVFIYVPRSRSFAVSDSDRRRDPPTGRASPNLARRRGLRIDGPASNRTRRTRMGAAG